MMLVTGASGFIGQRLGMRLEREGAPFVAASRSGTNFRHARNVKANLIDSNQIPSVLDGVDTIIHLAGRAHQLKDPSPDPLAEFRRVNRDASLELACQASQRGVKRFVFVSSIGVNGSETMPGAPFREDDVPHPQEPYAVSKREAEEALLRFGVECGMEIVIVRPPLVYGSGAPGNFDKLLKLVRTGLPLPLGRIRNRRSFIYVDNLVDILVLLATHPNVAGRTYVVSDGDDTSTPELIQSIAAMLGRKALLVPVPLSLLELPLRILGRKNLLDKLAGSLEVDSSRIRNELNWKPRYTLEEGLRHTLLGSDEFGQRQF